MAYELFYKLMVQFLLVVGTSSLVNAAGTDYTSLNDEQLFDQIQEDKLALGDDLQPGLPYYQLVLKVNEAVSRRLLTVMYHTRIYYTSKASTDLYRAYGYSEGVRLPSISDVTQAKTYLESHRTNAPHNDWLPIIITNDFLNDPVRDLQIDFVKIRLDQAPGENYYTLVLKVAEAFKEGYIKQIPDTKRTEERGMHVELYKVEPNNDQVLLPSVGDLDKAKDYFRRANGHYKTVLGGHSQDEHLPHAPNYYTDDEKEDMLGNLIEQQENGNRQQTHTPPFQDVQHSNSIDSEASVFIQKKRRNLGFEPDETPKKPTNKITNDISTSTGSQTKNKGFPDDEMKIKDKPKGRFDWFRRLFRRNH